MKKKVSLAAKILNELEINRDNENVFMSAMDLAAAIYGHELFTTKTSKFQAMQEELITCVKQSMCHARDLADENGITVIPKRKLTQFSSRKFHVLGWKIYTKGDEEFLVDELNYKKENGQARINSFNKLKENATRRGLIALEELKQLSK